MNTDINYVEIEQAALTSSVETFGTEYKTAEGDNIPEKTFADLMEEEQESIAKEVAFYMEVLKYVKHSKKKQVAQRKLDEAAEWQQFQIDFEVMSMEELHAKYPQYV